jgi:NCS1 family nucleobase:cation symporter-1
MTSVEEQSDRPGHIEVRGIEYIPAKARHGRPFELFPLWLSSNLSYLYILFGGILVLSGLSVGQALAVVFIGNLFYVFVGLIAVAGPRAGTSTAFISQVMFGRNGNRLLGSFPTWFLTVSFEAINLSIGALAGFALLQDAGVHVTTPLKVVVLAVIAVATFALSILGHATIVKATTAVSVLIGLAAVILFVFVLDHAKLPYHPSTPLHGSALLAAWLVGLTLVASGPLSWVSSPAEFARYLPERSSPRSIVTWTFLGGYLSSVFLSVVGVLAGTAVDMADPQVSMKAVMTGWFYPVFLLLIIVGTILNNVLGVYSSGLALQALGLHTRRSRTVILDCVVGGAMTIYALFISNFLTTLNNCLQLSIVWYGPFAGVFVMDIILRRARYGNLPDQLETTERRSLYGFSLPGVVSMLVAAAATFLCANTAYWQGPISKALNGADISPYVGVLLSAATYAALVRLGEARAPGWSGSPSLSAEPLVVAAGSVGEVT